MQLANKELEKVLMLFNNFMIVCSKTARRRTKRTSLPFLAQKVEPEYISKTLFCDGVQNRCSQHTRKKVYILFRFDFFLLLALREQFKEDHHEYHLFLGFQTSYAKCRSEFRHRITSLVSARAGVMRT